MHLPFLTPENALIFRCTHIRNVPWILANGLHCGNSAVRDPGFVEIGLRDLIERRAQQEVRIAPGGVLSDYIPFYFTPRSVMLLKIVSGHGVPRVPKHDIVILVTSLRELAKRGLESLLTDRHASLGAARITSNLEEGLTRIDWRNLQASDFRHGDDDPERHERYQAEALVHRHIPLEALQRIVCYRPQEKAQLKDEIGRRGLELSVEAHPDWLFQ
ncbi:MAG: hypothetical protein A2W00_05755 [Candidatus Eisenbacteria bacterium RBG_16_71_46]|nr:MAG: hypothetical protein A2W00_05755 [Candidatus Eisenbacteria bacterium RBG_16_71_46]OGF24267.1 MAG: hypothetical protein A2V63_05430 [Candidatus Eisenbacteria bacterium RBG_19FT_COMBO_70_11]